VEEWNSGNSNLGGADTVDLVNPLIGCLWVGDLERLEDMEDEREQRVGYNLFQLQDEL
jgi:hypothetical protein